MNYQRIHDEIIISARNATVAGYTEVHHIIPRCMGGTDDPCNLVTLTARQHFIIHWLLYKIHKTRDMAFAWSLMNKNGKHKQRHTSRAFEYARKYMSEHSTGDGNHFFGKKHSDETKAKISESRTGTLSSNETKSKISKSLVGNSRANGNVLSDETKAKMRESHSKTILSDEARRLKGDTARGKKNYKWSGYYIIDGVAYLTAQEASDATGVLRRTINHRCKNPNFTNYTKSITID